jgi:hypothetical protein
MKKLAIFSVFTVALLSSTTIIAEPEIQFGGIFDFNTATRVQKKLDGSAKNLSANNKSVVFNSSANITAKITEQSNELKYGAKIVMITTTAAKKTAGFNGSHLFIESADLGKVEAGAPFDVSTSMQVNGNDVAAGPGGTSWDGIINANPKDAYGFDINVLDFYLSGFTSKNGNIVDREPSRKINYYTPKMMGFQFGITWIPDSTNGGADSKTASSAFNKRQVQWIADDGTLKKYNIRLGATNAFAFGISYEAEIAEATSFKAAVTGEVGKSLQQAFIAKDDKGDSSYAIDPNAVGSDGKTLTGPNKLKNLKSYDVGAQLTQGNFSYGVSYGNLCKSFTSNALDANKNTDFYTTAINYNQGPINVSLTYTGGSDKKNKFNSIALGSDYKIAPGLIAYAETAYVAGKGTGKIYKVAQPATAGNPASPATFQNEKQKFSGTSFVLGLKVKI